MARAREGEVVGTTWLSRAGWSAVAWALGLAFFFPVFWMFVTALKHSNDSYTSVSFSPTLEQFHTVLAGGIKPFLLNSWMASGFSTILVLVLAAPAAYALSIRPVRKWQDASFFFISTKMLPIVAAIVPLYIVARDTGLLDNIWALVILYTAMNLPIAVWMLRSFFLEIPKELLEAARIDGAGLLGEILEVIVPLSAPGLAATALICLIFAWNEFFYAVNLTSTTAATVPVFLVGFITSEGLFFAKLAAAATLASLPVIVAGWIAQKQLVRGLSMGAVK
jgi:sorbitol/mannitol transport system permease protein